MEDRFLQKAACIHPRFRLSWLNVDNNPDLPGYNRNLKDDLVAELKEEAMDMHRIMKAKQAGQQATQENRGEGASSNPNPGAGSSSMIDDDDEEDFFTFGQDFRQSGTASGDSAEAHIISCLTAFLNVNTPHPPDLIDDLRCPELKNLFLKYNTRLPSSASAERVFSKARHVFTKERTNLGDGTLDMLVVCSANGNPAFT